MVDIQSATAEIRRGKVRKKEEKPQDGNIIACPIPKGGHNKHLTMYTVGQKKRSQLNFVCNFVKTKDFNAVFTFRF